MDNMKRRIVEEYRSCYKNNVWRQWKKGKWQILHITKICHLIFPLPFVNTYFWTRFSFRRRFAMKSFPKSAGLWLGDAAAGEFCGLVGGEDAGFLEIGHGPFAFRGILSEYNDAPCGAFPDVGVRGKRAFRQRP